MGFESADYAGDIRVPPGWERATLGELLETIVDYRGYTPPKSPTGIPCLTAANVKNGRIRLEGVSYVSPEVYSQITTRGFPRPGDVLLTTEAPVGQVAEFPGDRTYHITRRLVALRARKTRLNGRFLLYSLLSPSTNDLLRSRLRGSTVERILKEDVTRLPIALPHVDEQAKIAQILGALDDKIDLNRRMNETLEEATRALFKSWFVDFDPVRAKAAGRQPFGMDAATAALFPDRFVDSELRAVPKGWSVVALEDLFVLKRGYDLPAAERRPGQVPIYSSSGHSGSHAEVKARGPGVVTGRYGTIGQVYFVDEDFWPLNTTLYVVDFKQTPPIYAYYALARVDFAKFSDKAAVPGVNRNHLHQELVVQPTPLAMMAFSSTVDTWRRRVLAATEESSTLGAIRDYLLPKLLSGEIRVRDAETLAGKAL